MELVRRAAANSLAATAPQVVGLALLTIVGFEYGVSGQSALGAATSVFGAAVMLTIGSSIVAMRLVSVNLRPSESPSFRAPMSP